MTCSDEQQYTWRMVAGDDSTRVFEYRNADDTPVDLTGYTAACLYDVGSVSGSVVGDIDNPTDGKVSVTLPSALTTTFRGNGEYRLKLTSGGGKVSTLVYGDLVVKQ